MNRRTFLKRTVFLTSAVLVPGSTGFLTRRAFAVPGQTFSLNLITGNPNQSLAAVECALKNSWAGDMKLSYTETPLSGIQVADIVLVRNNRLIDYRTAGDELSKQLRQISKELHLPKRVENPVLVQFATANHVQKPDKIHVYHRERLVAELALSAESEREIQGTRGKLVLGVAGGRAALKYASCTHKTCMKMGPLDKAGQNLVCIPNEVRIRVAGRNETGIDSLSF